ncbi:MAG: Rpn family recombination-promoting nuclease/putative transposase [Deltaproteobacteria bacterium]|nr:Rpn family recombination-promoting nuclease/putative transposase [Deltaproteobacteria bacterium]
MGQEIIEGKYINFFTDFSFKKLFGPPSREILIDFLNAILEGYENTITDLEYLNTEQLGESKSDRKAVFDLYCTTSDGSRIIVELQNTKQQKYVERSIYYSMHAVQEQSHRGDWNYSLKAVYVISILNFLLPEEIAEDDVITCVKLHTTKSKKEFSHVLNYIYLEIPKIEYETSELKSHREKWLYLLKNLAKLNGVPEGYTEEIFMKFLDEADLANMNADERLWYIRSLKAYRDTKNQMDYMKEEGFERGFEKGIEEGLKEGMEKGMEKGRNEGMRAGMERGMEKGRNEGMRAGMERGMEKGAVNIAKNLLGKGFSIEDIIELTGLSEEIIKTLK